MRDVAEAVAVNESMGPLANESMRRVTLIVDVPESVLDNYDDFRRREQGITVESCAASLCHEHDPKHGFIRFTSEIIASTPTDSTCSGASNCAAKVHVHGCYADRGNCDAPTEHIARPAE